MKKKTLAIGLVFGVLLMGVVSAGLVNYLSNIVTASVNVEGPIFYLDNTNILSEKEGSGYLKLNDDSVSGEEFILVSNRFYSDSLGVEIFYPLDFKINLEANVSNLPRNESEESEHEITETCSVDVTVYKVSSTGGSPEKLCTVLRLGLDKENVYEDYEISCLGSSDEINFNKGDRIELLLVEQCPTGASIDIKYGNSYIQMIPKII